MDKVETKLWIDSHIKDLFVNFYLVKLTSIKLQTNFWIVFLCYSLILHFIWNTPLMLSMTDKCSLLCHLFIWHVASRWRGSHSSYTMSRSVFPFPLPRPWLLLDSWLDKGFLLSRILLDLWWGLLSILHNSFVDLGRPCFLRNWCLLWWT